MNYKGYAFKSRQRGFGFCWRVISPSGEKADFCKIGHNDYQSSVEVPASVEEIGQFENGTKLANLAIAQFENGQVRLADGGDLGPLNEL
jgi:hypothetical protein